MHVTRRCLISGPTRMIDSITQKKSNLLEIKTTVIIYECFVFIYYVRNSKRLKFWALASQWLHAHRVQPPKINWNGTTSLTVMNLRRFIPKGWLFLDCKNWRPLQHKRGVQVEKLSRYVQLSRHLNIIYFSVVQFYLLKNSWSNPNWFQFTYWRKKKNQFFKIFNRSHYMKVLLLSLVVHQQRKRNISRLDWEKLYLPYFKTTFDTK